MQVERLKLDCLVHTKRSLMHMCPDCAPGHTAGRCVWHIYAYMHRAKPTACLPNTCVRPPNRTTVCPLTDATRINATNHRLLNLSAVHVVAVRAQGVSGQPA